MNHRVAATLLILASTATSLAAAPKPPKPFAAGNVLIGLDESNEIREFTPNGTLVRSFGSSVITNTPEDILVGPDGRIYVSQYSPGRVFVFDAEGTHVDTFGPNTNLSSARGLALAPNGNLYVASYGNNRILEFSLYGNSVEREIGVGAIVAPVPLAVGPDGHIYAGSISQKKIYEIDPAGTVVRSFGDAAQPHCTGMTVGPDGQLYVSSYETFNVMRFDGSGTKTGEFHASFNGPCDLGFGPDGNIWVMDSFNLNILTPSGLAVPPDDFDDFSTPNHAGGIGFVPAFFRGVIRGTLERDGQKPVKIKQKARIAVQPGSNVVTLWIEFDPVNPQLTAFLKAFPQLGFTFYGNEASSSGAKKRAFQGSMVGPRTLDHPTGQLQLAVNGKLGSSGAFLPGAGGGQLWISAPDRQLRATIRLTKRLN